MKKLVQRIVLPLSLFSLVAPISANQYLDVRLNEAIQQNSTYLSQSKYLQEVEGLLLEGACINGSQSQEASIVQVATILAADARGMLELESDAKPEFKNALASLVGLGTYGFSLTWLVGAMDTRSAPDFFFASTLHCLSGYILIEALKRGFISSKQLVLRGRRKFNMKAKVEILKMLLKHPDIDLTKKNKEGKTALELVQESLAEISNRNISGKRWHKPFSASRTIMQEAEVLLHKKQEEISARAL